MDRQVLLLELNEVSFDHLQAYAERGLTPNLSRLIEEHGLVKTVSEQRYEELEPWIQWVTAHTGLPYRAHRVFRLGDILKHDLAQIWERLEEHGLKVGAISPMNAKNRTQHAAFFVPDPWTSGRVTGGALLKRLYGAVAQAVQDNAHARVSPASAFWLASGLARYARPVNYRIYAALAAMRRPWSRAMFLDLFLSDLFIRETERTTPHFASLFLNGAAHIQHHYMFSSSAYTGEQRNPDWYVPKGEDPVGQVYRLYDRIVGQVRARFPRARLMLVTGLHQEPCEAAVFYWRLKDFTGFLRKLDVPFVRAEARMSRDFFIECGSAGDAAAAERILTSARAADGTSLFKVDNRGSDLFVELVWPNDIPADFVYFVEGKPRTGLRDDVSFVAIKNGQHNGIGYFIDTGAAPGEHPESFPLAELPARICASLGVRWQDPAEVAA